MAQDSNWFKMWPARRLAVAAAIPNGTQRAEFLYLVDYCLELGPLPDDDEELAFMTAMEPERIKALRPYLKRLATFQNGKMMINLAAQTIQERQEFAERMANNGRQGGIARAQAAQVKAATNGHSPLPAEAGSDNQSQTEPDGAKPGQAEHNTGYQTQAGPSQAKPGQARLSPVKRSQAQSSHTYMHTNMQTCKEEEIPPPKIPYTPPPVRLPVVVGGAEPLPDADVGNVFDALSDIFPAYNWNELQVLGVLAMKYKATPGQIRNFPDWLKRTHPRSTLNRWNFRDLFAESLKPVREEPHAETKARFESRAERNERNASLTLQRLGFNRPSRGPEGATGASGADILVDSASPRRVQSGRT